MRPDDFENMTETADSIDFRLERIISEIFKATEEVILGDREKETLPSAAELARHLGYRLETVKKKIRFLRDTGWVQSVGVSPKRYRFDIYRLSTLSEDDAIYSLILRLRNGSCVFSES